MKSGESRANANRRIRQEALREQLSNQGHVQHVVDNINKIEDLGGDLDSNEVNRLKIATEQRLRLINKYLPDLKSSEITGEGGDAIEVTDVTRHIVKP